MKEPALKKQPAANKLSVVPVKKGTAQASCCHTPPVAAAACLTHTGKSVLFIIRPLTSLPNTPGARLQTRGGEGSGEQKDGAGAPTLFPLPCYQHPTTRPTLPMSWSNLASPRPHIGTFRASVCSTSVHFLPHLRHTAQHTPDLDPRVSLECRTSKSSLITISGAHSKSPRRSSTRTTMLRRQWRRSQCGRHAGHACSLPGTAHVAQPALL